MLYSSTTVPSPLSSRSIRVDFVAPISSLSWWTTPLYEYTTHLSCLLLMGTYVVLVFFALLLEQAAPPGFLPRTPCVEGC